MQPSRQHPDKLTKQFATKVRHLLPIARGGGKFNSFADAIRAVRMIGEIVLQAVPESKSGQGGAVYQQLGQAVGHRGEWVYRTRCFVLRYSKQDMEALLRQVPHVTFSHLIQLLSVHDLVIRKNLELELAEKKWNVTQLKTAIQAKHKGPRRKGGPAVKLPADMAAGLRDILLTVEGLNRRWSVWRGELEVAKKYKQAKIKSTLESIAQISLQFATSVDKIARK